MQMRMDLARAGRMAACLPLLSMSLNARAQPPRTPPAPLSGPGSVVTYVESSPAKIAALIADLKAYAREIEKSPGKPAVILLREIGRSNRFVVLEQWRDMSSPSFAQAEALLAAEALPDVQAPVDRRVNHPTANGGAGLSLAALPPRAFFVLMHVDIRGNAGEGPNILEAQRGAVVSAPGALGYDVTVQDQRNNHFTVSEIWKSRAAYEAYTATEPPEEFRRGLATLIGAPFDDRFYAPVEK